MGLLSIVKRARNLGQHHIIKEEIPNLKIIQILILADLALDEFQPEILGQRMGNKTDIDRSSCMCNPNF